MARKYTSKETKNLIGLHRENLSRLEAAAKLPSVFSERIRACVGQMYASGIFESDVMNALEDRRTGESGRWKELIRLLYLLKRAKRQSRTGRDLLAQNKDRIEETVRTASAGSNALSWFFSSSGKKQNSEKAYEELLSETEGSAYWTASQNLLASVAENDAVTDEDGLDDFRSRTRDYRYLLRENIPAGLPSEEPIRELALLIEKFERVEAGLREASERADSLRDGIRTAAERMVMATVLDILRSVPVEEVNRDKRGFRVKSLRDAGYTTMADLYAASDYQLASVYGISEDAAYSIKDVAQDFAYEARRTAKIKLSVDSKTKESTKLVGEIFRYKQYSEAVDALDRFRDDYDRSVQAAIKDLRSVGAGIEWRFMSDAQRENVKKSFSYLKQEINGEYDDRARNIIRTFQSVRSPDVEDAWEDFRKNSILYFNILEDVVPGVLGNDDRLYGLPEDLAREIQEECFFPDGLTCELRRYQEWGVKYILHQGRVLLGDEMGLGKTVQAIAAMVSLKNTGASHFIVVCPASVLPNWCMEISSKSKLRVTKVHGAGRAQAFRSWIKTGGVAVTTYETTAIFAFDKAFSFDMLVVDEAHFIKNVTAARSQNVRELSKYTRRILFMTGTALENKVDEMISLIEVLRPRLADSIRDIAFMSTAPQFREKVAEVYYRRKREDVLTELPDLIESREWCAMSAEETRLYEADVLSKNYMGTRRLSWNVEDLSRSCKARRMLEIIEEAESEGRKVLIFSFFLDTIRKIHAFLGSRCCNPINGSLHPQRRQEIINEFDRDPNKTVLCAQIQSGGTGLNIQAASVVILCEPQLKPSIENQAISRAYRMGQARNVLVYRLLCVNSIDEKITGLLEEKQAIFDAFADKSVAAANAEKVENEVDNATFGRIIEEEIERIKEKARLVSSDADGSSK